MFVLIISRSNYYVFSLLTICIVRFVNYVKVVYEANISYSYAFKT